MSKSLLQFKAWSNSVVADDLHRVTLVGTVLQLTRDDAPEVIVASIDMAEPVEDPEALATKAPTTKEKEKEPFSKDKK